jgi:hypothetical protein
MLIQITGDRPLPVWYAVGLDNCAEAAPGGSKDNLGTGSGGEYDGRKLIADPNPLKKVREDAEAAKKERREQPKS